MKIFSLLFYIPIFNINRMKTNLKFELGNNYDLTILKNKNETILNNKTKTGFQDAALLPSKDIPKHPLLW